MGDTARVRVLAASFCAVAALILGAVTWWTVASYRNAYEEVTDRYVRNVSGDVLAANARLFDEVVHREADGLASRVAFALAQGTVGDLVDRTIASPRARVDLGGWLNAAIVALDAHFMTVVGTNGETIARGTQWREFGDKAFYKEFYPEEGASVNMRALVDAALAGKATSGFEALPREILEKERAVDGAAREGVTQLGDGLDKQARVELRDLPAGGAEGSNVETRGLAVITVQPVASSSGRIVGALVAGRLLSRDGAIPNLFKRISGAQAAIYLGTTSVDSTADLSNLSIRTGSVMPKEIADRVYLNESEWIGLTKSGKTDYFTSVKPIPNTEGKPIAALVASVSIDALQGLQSEQRARASGLGLRAIATFAAAALLIAAGGAFLLPGLLGAEGGETRRAPARPAGDRLRGLLGRRSAEGAEEEAAPAPRARMESPPVEAAPRPSREAFREAAEPGESKATRAKLDAVVSEMKKAFFEDSRFSANRLEETPPAEEAPAGGRARPHAAHLADFQELHEKLDRELERVGRSGDPLSCLMLGVDGYNLLLDRTSAEFLQSVFEGLEKVISETVSTDFVVGKFGESELLVVLPGMGRTAAADAAERIKAAVASRKFEYGAFAERLNVSIGVSYISKDRIISKAQLLLFAEDALFNARKEGGNAVAVNNEGDRSL